MELFALWDRFSEFNVSVPTYSKEHVWATWGLEISPADFNMIASFTFIEDSFLNYFWEVRLDFSEIFKCIWKMQH